MFSQLVSGEFPLHEYFFEPLPLPCPLFSGNDKQNETQTPKLELWEFISSLCQNFTKLETSGLKEISLRKHPFLLALRRWGRFARRNLLAKRPRRRRVRRNGCFRGLKGNLLSYSQCLVKFGLSCCQCGLVRFFFCFCSVYFAKLSPLILCITCHACQQVRLTLAVY